MRRHGTRSGTGLVATLLMLLCVARAEAGGNLVFVDTDTPYSAQHIVVSPGGEHVYTGQDGGLVVYSRDAVTGALTFVQQVGGGGPRFTVSPDGNNVYASLTNTSRLVVFTRNSSTGQLTFLEEHVGGSSSTTAPVLSPDGGQVYGGAIVSVSPSRTGVRVFTRNAGTGALTLLESVETGDGGLGTIVSISPDGAHVYAPMSPIRTATLSRNPGTGALTQTGSSLVAPARLTFSPDGLQAYSLGVSRVTVWSRNPGTGELTFLEDQVHGVAGVEGIEFPKDLDVAPDGRHVYVIGGVSSDFLSGDHAVVVFARDAGTGRLQFREAVRDDVAAPVLALYRPRAVAVTGDGQHVYAGTVFNANVTAFRRVLHECNTTPLVGCRPASPAPRGATIVLKDKLVDTGDRFDWKSPKNTGTTVADFGDPLTSTDYVVCIYDGSAAPQPVLSAAIPAGGYCSGSPCWTAGGKDDFRYKDQSATHEGSKVLRLKDLGGGLARIIVSGKGRQVLLPSLPLTTPVIGQVQASNGVCWDATVTTPRRNDAEVFTGKSG